jgi:hypothetical protein
MVQIEGKTAIIFDREVRRQIAHLMAPGDAMIQNQFCQRKRKIWREKNKKLRVHEKIYKRQNEDGAWCAIECIKKTCCCGTSNDWWSWGIGA